MNIESKTLNQMCPSCALYSSGECAGTTCLTWTGCVNKRNADPSKIICKPCLIFQPEHQSPEYRYNVQLWHSYDGGKSFWYAGYNRFFSDYYDAESWRKQQRKNLDYDLMFGRMGNGTTVCNMAREEYGDYQKVAHIDDCGAISWYIDNGKLPPYVLEDVNSEAAQLAEEFKKKFLKLPKQAALDMLNDRLNVGQFLIVFHEDNISEKSMEEIYDAYIGYLCKNLRRTMPAA